jgi:hypothetical protein
MPIHLILETNPASAIKLISTNRRQMPLRRRGVANNIPWFIKARLEVATRVSFDGKRFTLLLCNDVDIS